LIAHDERLAIDDVLDELDRQLRRDAEDSASPGGHRVEYVFAVDCPATREAGALVVRLKKADEPDWRKGV